MSPSSHSQQILKPSLALSRLPWSSINAAINSKRAQSKVSEAVINLAPCVSCLSSTVGPRAVVADAVGEPEHPAAAGGHRRLPEGLPEASQRNAGHVCGQGAGGQHERVQGLVAAVRLGEGADAVIANGADGEGGVYQDAGTL